MTEKHEVYADARWSDRIGKVVYRIGVTGNRNTLLLNREQVVQLMAALTNFVQEDHDEHTRNAPQ